MGLLRFDPKDSTIGIWRSDGLPHNNFRQGAFFKGIGIFLFWRIKWANDFRPEDIKLTINLPGFDYRPFSKQWAGKNGEKL